MYVLFFIIHDYVYIYIICTHMKNTLHVFITSGLIHVYLTLFFVCLFLSFFLYLFLSFFLCWFVSLFVCSFVRLLCVCLLVSSSNHSPTGTD